MVDNYCWNNLGMGTHGYVFQGFVVLIKTSNYQFVCFVIVLLFTKRQPGLYL